MDSFDFDEARKPSRKHPEGESKGSKDWAGGEARPGNQAMQKLVPKLRVQMAGAKGADVDEAIARAIQSKRGGGATLDSGAKKGMEQAMGKDFSDVRVHSDSDADSLSRSVQAKAFTTGKDIFFRSGEYQPGSTEGNKLLAHELTHVVQQQNAPPAQKLEVSHPEDASERQASQVADTISAKAATAAAPSVGRAEEDEQVARAAPPASPVEEEVPEEEAAPTLAREGEEEVPEEEAAPTLAREGEEEVPEEEAAPTLAREGEEEVPEEEAAPTLARQEEEEVPEEAETPA
jgi:hypothetical protein